MSQATDGQVSAQAAANPTNGHGIAMGTQVMTLDGALPVEYLSPGDRILTRGGTRRLAAIEVAVIHNAALIRICASTLGHDKPADDLLVSPDQPIWIRDWRAKALFGSDTAMIAAKRLADGQYIHGVCLPEARLYRLRFEQPCVIYAGNLELACEAEVAFTA
ncbi:MAG: Hint domain-containing protein [Cypionkella sp.]|nr:Hint domain-containing protein [Cypionkella sp.]